jgi:hypothetical protein
MEISEFLLARIAEDEASADLRPYNMPCAECGQDGGRVLAECEAKRRIVGDYGFREHAPGRGLSIFGERILGALASVYADHPDFDPAWRS